MKLVSGAHKVLLEKILEEILWGNIYYGNQAKIPLTLEFIWGTSITLIGKKLVLRIITNIDSLLKEIYIEENNCSTLQHTY